MSRPASGKEGSDPCTVTFRVDGGTRYGYGHLVRSLALAQEILRQDAKGWKVRFLVGAGSDPGPLMDAGHEHERLPGPGSDPLMARVRPDEGPLVIDTTEVSAQEVDALSNEGYTVVLFDDGKRCGGRSMSVLVDSAPGADQIGYGPSPDAQLCLGPRYHVMRAPIVQARRDRQSAVSSGSSGALRLLVSFGGSDPEDATHRFVQGLISREVPWPVELVLGPGYKGRLADGDDTRALAGDRIRVHRAPRGLGRLMASCDLALTSAGGTALELAYLGVPSVLVSIARDQLHVGEALEASGAAMHAGWHEDVEVARVIDRLGSLAGDPDHRARMAAAGQGLVDGRGGERVARAVFTAWERRGRWVPSTRRTIG